MPHPPSPPACAGRSRNHAFTFSARAARNRQICSAHATRALNVNKAKETAMLTIFGKPHRNGGFCDGVSRRDFLAIGGSGLGGFTVPNLLRAGGGKGGG